MSITLNPMAVTNAAGTFPKESGGLIVGTAYSDPASRNYLAGGPLAASEVLPMFGGVGISESIPGAAGGPSGALGGIVSRATSNATLTGFSVFDQAHHMINVPGSPVPQVSAGMSVHFYRFGSNARIALAIDPSLVSNEGGLITQSMSWDYVNSRLIPYVAAYPANVFTAFAYNAGTGQVTATTTTAHGLVPGDDIQVSGMTPAGYNTSYTCVAGTTGSTIVAVPLIPFLVNPGAVTVEGTLIAGGGSVPVRILEVQIGNSMVPEYNPVTGLTAWNYTGSAAVALI